MSERLWRATDYGYDSWVPEVCLRCGSSDLHPHSVVEWYCADCGTTGKPWPSSW